jgi:hypothetical protein
VSTSRRAFCISLPSLAALPRLYASGFISKRSQSSLDLHSMMQPIPRTAAFRVDGYEVWGGSVVQGDDGKFHMFYSRWPLQFGGNAWVVKSEIAHAVSDTPFGTFKHHDVALPRRGKNYWDGMVTHNPTIQRFGDMYYLYYMGNTGDDLLPKGLNMLHRNNQRIGVAVASSPYGPWKRFGSPVIDVSQDSSAPDSLCVANPSIARGPDGLYHLLYKGVGQERPLPFGGPVVHLIATSTSPTGPFQKNLKPLFLVPGETFPFEDPFLWFDPEQHLYFCIMKDNHGVTSGSHESTLVLFQSSDTVKWEHAKNFVVSDLTLHWEDNTIQSVSRLERPQVAFDKQSRPIMLVVAIVVPGEKQTFNVRIPLQSKA